MTTAVPTTTAATAPRRRRTLWIAFIATLVVLAVLAALAARFLLQPSVDDVQGRVAQVGQSAERAPALNGDLQQGQTLIVHAQTERTDEVRVVLRDGDSGDTLATVPDVAVGSDGSVLVPVDATSDLDPGRYIVALYLDGGDTVSGSLGFTVAP